MIIQQGQINTTALWVPEVYVQIIPPQLLLNGVPSNIVGIVGTATWGPVNAPTIIGGYNQYATLFGPMQARKYDMGTALWAAALQQAMAFMCVRVTDGTDTAANQAVSANSVASLNITAPGSYTTIPAITIGGNGTGATASALMKALTAAIANAGGGYAVNDTITLAGGTSSQSIQIVVTGVGSGGTITSFALSVPGNYSALPSNPLSQASTTGIGSGATFNITAWGVLGATITAGGNGYTSATATFGSGAATATVNLTNAAMQFTSMYTGSLGNSIQVTISAGTQVGTYRIVVAMPGLVPENFDNISGSGNALWLAMASAVNNGITGVRGPSKIITASAGTSTAAPALATYALSGGTDGATTINGAVLLGQDSTPRKGMYALRGTQAGIGMLADCDDSTTWSTQVQFGLSQGIYMIGTGPAGDTISNAINVKAAAGIDSYAFKLIFGDWVYINDTVNAMQRMISPQGFEAGMLGALSPEQSSLNKQMQGIIGTQKTIQNLVYSYAELQSLGQAGFELITNPSPGGNYFAARFGRNSSSNATIHWDSYTRMTNYLAATLNAGMGKYDGDLQSASVRAQALATINYFLSNLWDQGMIGNPAGTIPYSTKCDNTNNSSSREALGYMQIDVKVQYLAVIDYLIINLEGGSIVQIQNGNALPAQAAA